MSDIIFKSAWRKADPDLERDAKAFWQSNRVRLPPTVDPSERAAELCAIAYREDRPVGVSTATIEMVERLRCRMAVYRCATKIGLRHTPLSWRITEYSLEVLERWSLENPEEKVMGLMALIQSRELILRYPGAVMPAANLVFVGFSPAGFPIRVSWFKHATIPTEWPPRPLRPVQAAQPAVKAPFR